MTKAKMDWETMTLEMDGHANSAPAGKDLVCAAESILTQALVNTLAAEEERAGIIKLDVDADKKAGTMRIHAMVPEVFKNAYKPFFKVCVTGLRMLAEQYPEYIQLKEV